MSFISNLIQQCDIYTTTITQDALGGTIKTLTKVISLAPCLLQTLSATKRSMAGATGVDVSHRLFMQIQTISFQEDDIVQVGTTQYKIIYIYNVRGHHLELDLQELKRGA